MAVFDIRGKTFLVTGGASGMGALHVESFLDQGAKAVAIIDILVEKGKVLTEKYPNKAFFFQCDISKEEEIEKTFNEVVTKLDRIDVIINNAGIFEDGPEMWRLASMVNWQGVVSFTFKGIKHMSKAEGGLGGTIVNISSTGALNKFPYVPVYCGSKIAVLHFSQCLSMDPFFDTTGIKVICMCIGPTYTTMLENVVSRAYTHDMGKIFDQSIKSGVVRQRPESAVAVLDYVIKYGQNGSVWLSFNDKPPKDITSAINEIYAANQKLISD